MDTSSVDTFAEYEAYLRRFSALQAGGRICPTQRGLTFQRYLSLVEATEPERLERILFPAISQARRCYISSALGYTAAGIAFLEEIHRALEALGLEVLDPWDWTDDGPLSRDGALALGRSRYRALDSCGRVLAVLDGCEVDAAVAAEIGYARALGKRIDGIRTDTRLSGDCSELPVNLAVAVAIIDSGGMIANCVEDLPLLDWGLAPKRGLRVTSQALA